MAVITPLGGNTALTPVTQAPDGYPVENEQGGALNQAARSLKSSLLSGDANSAAHDYFDALSKGDRKKAKQHGLRAQQLMQEASDAAPRVQSLGDVHGAGDAGDWLAAQAGAAPMAVAKPVLGGLAGAAVGAFHGGASGAAVGGTLGGLGAMYPDMRNAAMMEHMQALDGQDPTQTQAQEALNQGSWQAVGQTLPYAIAPEIGAAGRVFGGKAVLPAAKSLTGSLTRGAVLQGGAGAASSEIGHKFQDQYNPNRDKSHDAMANIDAAAGNALIGVPFEAVGHAGQAVHGTLDAGLDLGAKGAKVAGKAAMALGGKGAEAAKQAWDNRPKDLTEAAVRTGEAAADAHTAVEDAFTRFTQRGKDADVDTLLKPQGKDMDQATWRVDTADKHKATSNVVDKISRDPGSYPDFVRQAAEDYANSSKMGESWRPVRDAINDWKRSVDIADSITELSNHVADKGGKLAADVAKAGEAVKDAYQGRRDTRSNAQAPDDKFIPILADAIAPHLGLRTEAVQQRVAPVAARALHDWIAGGMADRDGSIAAPRSLLRLLPKDPINGLSKVIDLMHRQGVIDAVDYKNKAAVLKDAQQQIHTTSKVVGLLKDRLLPTEEATMDPTQRRSLIDAMATGKLDEKTADKWFGPNAGNVLDDLSNMGLYKRQKDIVGTTAEHVPGEEPNTVVERHEYHHYREARGDSPAEPYRRKGFSTPDPETGEMTSHDEHAAARQQKLQDVNKSAVQKVGYLDYLREQYGHDPETLMGHATEFMSRKQDEIMKIKGKGSPDEKANANWYVLRETLAGDRGEATNIDPKEFATLGKTSKWAEQVNHDEYGTIKKGRIWLERKNADGTVSQFATSTHKIIQNMLSRSKAEGGGSEMSGLAGQHRLLMQGLSGLAENEALTGRIGYKLRDNQKEPTWLGKNGKLPPELPMLGNKGTLGAAEKLAHNALKREIVRSTETQERQEAAQVAEQPKPATARDKAAVAATEGAALRASSVVRSGVANAAAFLRNTAKGSIERAALIDGLRTIERTAHRDGLWDKLVPTERGQANDLQARNEMINTIQKRARKLLELFDDATHVGKGAEKQSERASVDLRRSKYPPAETPAGEIEQMSKQKSKTTAPEDGGTEKPRTHDEHTGNRVGEEGRQMQRKDQVASQDAARVFGDAHKDLKFRPLSGAENEAVKQHLDELRDRLGDAMPEIAGVAVTDHNGWAGEAHTPTEGKHYIALSSSVFDDKTPMLGSTEGKVERAMLHEVAHAYDRNDDSISNQSAHFQDSGKFRKEMRDAMARREDLHDWYSYVDGAKDAARELYAQAFTLYHYAPEVMQHEQPEAYKFFKAHDNAVWKPVADGRASEEIRAQAGTETDLRSDTRQSAQDPARAFGNDTQVAASKEEQAKFHEDIARRLGPGMQSALEQNLYGKNAIGKKIPISGEWSQGLIKASVFAKNLGQIGAHESFHEFFNRLKDQPQAAKVMDILNKAADSPYIQRQLERLLDGEMEALKQIKKGAPHYLEERQAYMFQFHQAGLLKIGPETETTFQKIARVFRTITGMLTNDQKADRILRSFDRGEMRGADAAARVLHNNIEARENMYKAVNSALSPALTKLSRVVNTAETNLRANGYDDVRRMFKRSVGESGPQGFLDAKDHQMKQWSNKVAQIFDGLHPKDLELAAPYLHSGERATDPAVMRLNALLKGGKVGGKQVEGLLPAMHKYLNEAGVKLWVPDKLDPTKGSWEPMGHVKNYFPRVLDTSQLVQRGDEFATDLMKHNSAELNKMAASINAETKDKEGFVPTTGEALAKAITNRMIQGFGQADLSETSSAVGFSPFMQAVNRRTLEWLHPEVLKKWGEKDVAKILNSYVAQGVKRAEYVRRFGNGGENLKAALEAKYEDHVQKLVDGGMKKEEAEARALKVAANAAKDVMAMEGTLGYNISNGMRRFQNSAMVYENMRTLSMSLFSQFIDPMNMVVRGSTMGDAWSAYKRGMREVAASIKGEHIKDLDSMIADQVGTTDAGGMLAAYGQLYSSQYMGAGFRKANDMLFKYNGMEGFNRGMQVAGTRAAINFIKRHVEKPNERSKDYLAELNLKARDVKIDKDGELDYTDPKIQQAIHQWVNGSVMRPNAAQRPAWGSDPHYMVLWHMKQFAYTFHDVIMKRAMHDYKKYGDMGPAGVLAATYAPIMIASDAMKSMLVTGQEPGWMKAGLGSEIEHGVMRAGLAGKFQPLADVALTPGRSMLGLGGPLVEQITQLADQTPHDAAVNALPGANLWNMLGGHNHIEVQGED
jgi:hypothetical protein